MLANYGYADASGDYFLSIDTDKCDGCGDCVTVCPAGVLEIAPDDFDKMVAQVPAAMNKKLAYLCPGIKTCQGSSGSNCQQVCPQEAIGLTW